MPGNAIHTSKLRGHGDPPAAAPPHAAGGPAVVTEALPLQPHLVQRRRGQDLQGGKRRHPTRPVGSDRQLGLLQHHFGNPDAVGIQMLLRRWANTTWQQLPRDIATAMVLHQANKAIDSTAASASDSAFMG